jgi:hypothetical protein
VIFFLLIFQLWYLFFSFLFFILDPFVKVVFVFNLELQFICHVLFFQSSRYSFNFNFFFLDHFINFLLVFNFIIQSKFKVYYFFQFYPYSFNCFYPFC